MFSRFGQIAKITVPIDKVTTRNKGYAYDVDQSLCVRFAFIQFENRKDAEEAYEHYRGTTVEGRRIKIDWDVKSPPFIQNPVAPSMPAEP